MVFGLLLVFSTLFLFHSKKNQTSLSSIRPQQASDKATDELTLARMRKLEGLRVNNDRISAEINKEDALLGVQNKTLRRVLSPNPIDAGIGLSQEANAQTGIHDRSAVDSDRYPDIYVPKELALDHAAYEQALINEQQDRKAILDGLQKRAAQQNLDFDYDPKTGDVTIQRRPQSEAPGVSK